MALALDYQADQDAFSKQYDADQAAKAAQDAQKNSQQPPSLLQRWGSSIGKVTSPMIDSALSEADAWGTAAKRVGQDVAAGGITGAVNIADAAHSFVQSAITNARRTNVDRVDDAIDPANAAREANFDAPPSSPIWDHAKASVLDFRDAVAVKDPNMVDGLTQSVAQLAIPFTGFSRALAGLHGFANMALAGGITDATALAPHDMRMADLISLGRTTEGKLGDALRTLAPDGSAVNAYINFLTDRGNESEAEGRFKNVLDGFGVNLIATPLLHTVGMVLKQGTAGLRYMADNGVGSSSGIAPRASQVGAVGDLAVRPPLQQGADSAESLYEAQVRRDADAAAANPNGKRPPLVQGGDPADSIYDDKVRRDVDSAHAQPVADAAASSKWNIGGKPVWEMQPDEIDEAVKNMGQRDVSTLKEAFGSEEDAGKYARLADSESDKAYDKANAMLDALPPEKRAIVEKWERGGGPTIEEMQQGAKWTPSASPPELKAISRDVRDVQSAESPQELSQLLKYAVTSVGDHVNPADMNHHELSALMQLRAGYQLAAEKGWDTAKISKDTLTAAAARFSDPEDAYFMLRKYMKIPDGAGVTAQPTLPALSDGVANVPNGWGSIEGGSDSPVSALEADPAATSARTFLKAQADAGHEGSLHAMVTTLGAHLDGSTEEGAFYKDILSKLSAKNLETQITSPGGVHPTTSRVPLSASGHYSPAEDTVALYPRAFQDNKTLVHTVAHEAVHAATLKAMTEQPAVTSALTGLLGETKAAVTSNLKPYGLTNAREFVAEAESNPKFQQLLKDTKSADGRPLWDHYKEVLGGIFGVGSVAVTSPMFDKLLSKEKKGA